MAYDSRGVHAIYSGTYVTADIWAEDFEMTHEATFPAALEAKKFSEAAAMFRDQVLSITGRGLAIRLQSKDQMIELRKTSEQPSDIIEAAEGVTHFTMSVTDLISEVALATEFVSLSTTVPILTGVRMVVGGGRVGFMAFDGSAGLFVTSVDCDVATPLDATFPPFDLLNALKLIESGPVTVASIRLSSGATRTAFFGSNAIVHTVSMNGKWPNVESLTRPVERLKITIPAEKLDRVAQSVRVLNADNVLILQGGDPVRLMTRESEAGQFETVLEAAAEFSIPQIIFDISTIKLAAKLGKDVTLEVAPSVSIPTLIQSGKRRYWIGRRVQ